MFKKNKEVDFFNLFIESAEYICKASEKLLELVKNYSNTEQKIANIKEIEHQADIQAHTIYKELNKAFITPIEREDILALNQGIDNVIDIIDRIAKSFSVFHIQTVETDAINFIEIANRTCICTKKAIMEMRNFKKPAALREAVIKINDIEEEGDDFYSKSVTKLFSSNKDPLYIMKWYEILNQIEDCIDTCEDISNIIEDIILKNT